MNFLSGALFVLQSEWLDGNCAGPPDVIRNISVSASLATQQDSYYSIPRNIIRVSGIRLLNIDPEVCLVNVNDTFPASYQSAIAYDSQNPFNNVLALANGINYCYIASEKNYGNGKYLRSTVGKQCYEGQICQDGNFTQYSNKDCSGLFTSISLSDSAVVLEGQIMQFVTISGSKAVTQFTVHYPPSLAALQITSSLAIISIIILVLAGISIITCFLEFSNLYWNMKTTQYGNFCVIMVVWGVDLGLVGYSALSAYIGPEALPVIHGTESILYVLATTYTCAMVTINLYKIAIRESKPRNIMTGALFFIWLFLASPRLFVYFYVSSVNSIIFSSLYIWNSILSGYWGLFCHIYNSCITAVITIDIIRIFRIKSQKQNVRDSISLIYSDPYFKAWISTNFTMAMVYVVLSLLKNHTLVFNSDHEQEFVFVVLRVLTMWNSLLSLYIVDRYPLVIMSMRSFKKKKGALTIQEFQNEMVKSSKTKVQDRLRKSKNAVVIATKSSVISEREIAPIPKSSDKPSLTIETTGLSAAQSRSSPVSMIGPIVYLNSRKQGSVTGRSVTVKAPPLSYGSTYKSPEAPASHASSKAPLIQMHPRAPASHASSSRTPEGPLSHASTSRPPLIHLKYEKGDKLLSEFNSGGSMPEDESKNSSGKLPNTNNSSGCKLPSTESGSRIFSPELTKDTYGHDPMATKSQDIDISITEGIPTVNNLLEISLRPESRRKDNLDIVQELPDKSAE